MCTRRLEHRQRQEATLHPEPLALPGASKGTTAASLSGTSCQGGAATSCWTPRNCGAQGVGSPSHQGTACARVQCAGATAGRGCNQGTACARVQCARVMAQALLQSTPLFSRHLRRQHAQGQVLDPPRHLRRHLRSHVASGDQRGARSATGGIGGTRSLWSGYGIRRRLTKLLLQSTAQRQHQLWRGSRKLVAQAALQTTPFPAWRRRVWRVMSASSRAWSIR